MSTWPAEAIKSICLFLRANGMTDCLYFSNIAQDDTLYRLVNIHTFRAMFFTASSLRTVALICHTKFRSCVHFFFKRSTASSWNRYLTTGPSKYVSGVSLHHDILHRKTFLIKLVNQFYDTFMYDKTFLRNITKSIST